MYHYQLQITNCIYQISSDLPCYFRPEEEGFIIDVNETFHTEDYRVIQTHIYPVEQLPFEIKGADYDGDGVKIYHRNHIQNHPVSHPETRTETHPVSNMDNQTETHPVSHLENQTETHPTSRQEIRTYYASFLENAPVYAQSCFQENQLDIYVKMTDGLWFDPNIRIWNLLHLEQVLFSMDALILHCSYMMYENEAILFSAPSGTGKTTQAKLWEKHYGSRIINGDKAIIQKKDDNWYACGYPYHGSADECENLSYRIKAIVIVRQSPEDKIVTESGLRKIRDIYSECTINNWQEESIQKAFDLIADLTQKVTVVKEYCTMDPSAADTLHRCLYHT